MSFYGFAYRSVMHLAHKHGWHYAPQKPISAVVPAPLDRDAVVEASADAAKDSPQ